MNTKRYVSSLGVLASSAFLAVVVAGCSASDKGPGGTGGSAGSGTSTANGGSSGSSTAGMGGSGNSSATQLTFDQGGFVAMSAMTKGVHGAFYAYGDGQGMAAGSQGTCQVAGHTSCSMITMTPDVIAQKICATGTAAMVPGTDYSAVFGAGIGLDLNNGGAEAGTGKQPYDATANGVTGVGFTLNATDTYGGDFRIEFPAQGQDSIGTNAPARYDSILAGSTTVNAEFADATVGYQMPPDGIPVAKNALLSFQWHVATKTDAAIPFSFCLSNIHLLTQ